MFFGVLGFKVEENVKKWGKVVKISISLSTFEPSRFMQPACTILVNYGDILRNIRMQNGCEGQDCSSFPPEGSSPR